MIKPISLVVGLSFLLGGCVAVKRGSGQNLSGRDDLRGSVRTVRLVSAALADQSGRRVEGPRGVAETRLFDRHGNEVETVYAAGDSVLFKVVSRYDNTGEKLESVAYDPSGGIREKTAFGCDHRGHSTESQEYRGDDVVARNEYSYDAAGNRTEWTRFNSRGAVIDKWVYHYDDRGNRHKDVRYYADGSVDAVLAYKFDSDGNATRLDRMKPDGSVIESELYEYEFDFSGNWTRRITSRQSGAGRVLVPSEITYREIEYR